MNDTLFTSPVTFGGKPVLLPQQLLWTDQKVWLTKFRSRDYHMREVGLRIGFDLGVFNPQLDAAISLVRQLLIKGEPQARFAIKIGLNPTFSELQTQLLVADVGKPEAKPDVNLSVNWQVNTRFEFERLKVFEFWNGTISDLVAAQTIDQARLLLESYSLPRSLTERVLEYHNWEPVLVTA